MKRFYAYWNTEQNIEMGKIYLQYLYAKGQLISKCLFGVKTSSKKPTKNFPGFLP